MPGSGRSSTAAFSGGLRTALATWTGSTNWTPTGLCTQLNNGLLIDEAHIG